MALKQKESVIALILQIAQGKTWPISENKLVKTKQETAWHLFS